MDVAEVTQLAEAFVGDTTIADLRHTSSPLIDVIANFTDEQYALLVRFIAGERPEEEHNFDVSSAINRLRSEMLAGFEPLKALIPPPQERLKQHFADGGKARDFHAAANAGLPTQAASPPAFDVDDDDDTDDAPPRRELIQVDHRNKQGRLEFTEPGASITLP